jgi:hypothetical protein
MNKAKDHLAPFIPHDWKVNFVAMTEIAGSDAVHNRYLLSDIGGVIIPFGADDFTRDKSLNVEDDITLMLAGMFDRRWRQYSNLDPARIIGSMG